MTTNEERICEWEIFREVVRLKLKDSTTRLQDYVSSEQMMKALEAVGHPFRLDDASWIFWIGRDTNGENKPTWEAKAMFFIGLKRWV